MAEFKRNVPSIVICYTLYIARKGQHALSKWHIYRTVLSTMQDASKHFQRSLVLSTQRGIYGK